VAAKSFASIGTSMDRRSAWVVVHASSWRHRSIRRKQDGQNSSTTYRFLKLFQELVGMGLLGPGCIPLHRGDSC
jgi:hypothetical protein